MNYARWSAIVPVVCIVVLSAAAASLAAAAGEGTAATAPAATTAPAGGVNDPAYPVTKLVLRYLRSHPKLPPLEQALELKVDLGTAEDGFPAAGAPTKPVRIKDLAGEHARMHASAIQKVLERVRDDFLARGYMGVYVAPDPFEIDESGRDLRPAGHGELHVVVTVGMVTSLRTLASGERIDPEARVNNPAHARVRAQSPIQPFRRNDPERNDLLRKDLLDDYAFWLSRHPGRRADVALSSGLEPGSVTLDYLITENKPWSVFAQTSNTGTRNTSSWVEQFGFSHDQLTGNDDVLSVIYSTASFDQTNSISISYEAPIAQSRWLRWRVYGGWSEFTASDVGFAGDIFTGEDWNVGGEAIATVFQDRALFVDLFAGGRFDDTRVDNTLPGDNQGHEQFLLPHVGVRMNDAAEWFSTHGSVSVEWNDGDVTGVSQDQVDRLGRPSADRSWTTLQWDVSGSVYIEPILYGERWHNPASGKATLAHELYAGFRGQYGFDNRLIAHAEQTVGGFYSVRGYPDSAVAGDTVLVGTLEYRYHVPRAFAIAPEPGKLFNHTFRYAPQYPYGLPDWDLILRAFLDVGEAINSHGDQFSEQNATLVSTGAGVEFLFKRNLSLRMDWGVALRDLPERDIQAGSNRFHFLFTILY